MSIPCGIVPKTQRRSGLGEPRATSAERRAPTGPAPKGISWLIICRYHDAPTVVMKVENNRHGLTAFEAWREASVPVSFSQVETIQLDPYPIPQLSVNTKGDFMDLVLEGVERIKLYTPPRFCFEPGASFRGRVLMRDDRHPASDENDWLQVYVLKAESEVICYRNDERVMLNQGELFVALELDLEQYFGLLIDVTIDQNMKATIQLA